MKAKDRWRHHFKINRAAEIQEQQSYWEAWAKNTGNTVSSRAGEEEVWRTYGYDGGLGGHGSEGFRVEGERRWISSASIGRERLREWAALLQETASNELEELGKLCWSTTGLEEPPTTSTMRAQLTVTSDLDKVSDILEAETTTVGLLERRLVWSEGPWRADNMLRAWEGVLEGKAFAKRPKCGNDDECCGHPVPIARMVEGKRVIDSFCQTCWTWSDFRKNKSVPLPMTFLEKWGVFNTRLARPDKGRLRGKLTDEEFEKLLSTYVKGNLSPGPDGVISELLRDATATERRIILHWINMVLTSEEPGLRLSLREVHGLVALLHKGGSTDRASDYRPVVLLNSLFQLISYVI